jgi:type IV secretory pathway TrbD component
VTARGRATAVIAGLLLAAVGIVAESRVVASFALGATLVLLPAAVFMDLVRGDPRRGLEP